jgi:DtxR family Mn-dependent transcriptional regulator
MERKKAYRPTPRIEDYLERIAVISEGSESVTVTALAKLMGVTKPSVVWAIRRLCEEGLATHERFGGVRLTAAGSKAADDVRQRHEVLRRFLTEILDIEPDTADKQACEIEHVLAGPTLGRLQKFLEFVLECPRGHPEWLEGLKYYFEHGRRNEHLLARCER